MRRVDEDALSFNDRLYTGYAYYFSGRIAEAKECFDYLAGESDYTDFIPYQIDEREGNLAEALRKLKNEYNSMAKDWQRSRSQVVTSSIIKRREQERAYAEKEAALERRLRIWVTVAAVLAAGACVVWGYITTAGAAGANGSRPSMRGA